MITKSGLEVAERYDLVQVFRTYDQLAQGLSQEEAARKLGVTIDSVKKTARRGRDQLSEILQVELPNTIAAIAQLVQLGWIRPD